MNKSNCKLSLYAACLLMLIGSVLLGGWGTRRGQIEGRVLDEQRRPLTNVGIVVTATTAKGGVPEILPLSNEQGKFTLGDLGPGRYTLRAARDGYQEQTRTVQVRAGRTAQVEFVLRSGG